MRVWTPSDFPANASGTSAKPNAWWAPPKLASRSGFANATYARTVPFG